MTLVERIRHIEVSLISSKATFIEQLIICNKEGNFQLYLCTKLEFIEWGFIEILIAIREIMQICPIDVQINAISFNF